MHTAKEQRKNHTTQNNLHKEPLSLMERRGFGVTRVRFHVFGLLEKRELRTLSHLTLRCHVTLFVVAAVVDAACDLPCAQARASMRERCAFWDAA